MIRGSIRRVCHIKAPRAVQHTAERPHGRQARPRAQSGSDGAVPAEDGAVGEISVVGDGGEEACGCVAGAEEVGSVGRGDDGVELPGEEGEVGAGGEVDGGAGGGVVGLEGRVLGGG